MRFKNDAAKIVSAFAQARKARVPFVVVETIVFPAHFLRCIFSRRIAEVEIYSFGRNADAVAFAAEQNFWRFFLNRERLGDFADGDDGFGAVVQRGHKRAGRAQHVEHDARGRAQIALGERGQFHRRQDGFNFHLMSREGREGGEGN